jgi:hypothetical protein
MPLSTKPIEVKDIKKYCTSCGSKVKENWLYCANCAKKIE